MRRFVFFFAFLFFAILFWMTKAVDRDGGSGYLAFNEDSILYEWAGFGQKLVLIHDGLLHREIWDDQFSSFSKDYKVIIHTSG